MIVSSVTGLHNDRSLYRHENGGEDEIWILTYGHRGLGSVEGDHGCQRMASAEIPNAERPGYECGDFAHVYDRALVSFAILYLASFLLCFSWV